mgnify:CR=1 FL=1
MNTKKAFNDLFMTAMLLGLFAVPFAVFGVFNGPNTGTDVLSETTEVRTVETPELILPTPEILVDIESSESTESTVTN